VTRSHDTESAPKRREPTGEDPGPARDARAVALRVLERVEEDGAYADLALRAALAQTALDARDRAFATELAYGTLRWRGRLDFLLAGVLDRPLESLEPRVQRLLRLGAYQLAFCDRVPDAAAVSQAVRLARATGMARASGLVNAALRRLARERDAIALPALEADPIGHLVHALSIPKWIAERWIAAWGPAEAAAFAAVSNAAPPRAVRANRLRNDRAALRTALAERFPDAVPCRLAPDGLLLGRRGDPASDPAFRDGRFTVQDEASQLVVELLDPQPGERVLDACAAPGTKATAIAERVGPAGRVLALDRHERRLGLVARDAARLGIDWIEPRLADATDLACLGDARFDRVLVDAPCSGLGALRRNPDARWRVQPESIEALAHLQRAILAEAAALARPGGTIVYSTCTLAREENEDVVDAVLADAPALRRVGAEAWPATLRDRIEPDGALRCRPHRDDTDGFYAVRMERTT
jgi:16S rRNA (cytosine967-C5)-methyltransferase